MIVGGSDAADRHPQRKPNSRHTGTVSITLRAAEPWERLKPRDPVRPDALESRFHSVRRTG
jgi:hypothetical protein